jgi:catechol 2,3-dioxygenase
MDAADATGAFGIPPRGYRLPPATRLGPVELQVSGLAESVEFYQRVLGLRPSARTAREASLASQDGRTLVNLRSAAVHSAPSHPRLGLYHFAILLPDRAALGRFLAHSSGLRVHVGMADHAVSESVYLSDPDGLGIEVYADRPRPEWRVRPDRQLHMTTEPLDVRAVVAAAGGQAWSGMPAGTVMGHVHLHVGDLTTAAGFYHSALGFDTIVWDYPGALFLAAGGYHHHLGTNTWSRGAPAQEGDPRLLAWELVLPSREEVDAAARSLSGAGYAPADAEGACVVTDPWGTTLRIVDDTRARDRGDAAPRATGGGLSAASSSRDESGPIPPPV